MMSSSSQTSGEIYIEKKTIKKVLVWCLGVAVEKNIEGASCLTNSSTRRGKKKKKNKKMTKEKS